MNPAAPLLAAWAGVFLGLLRRRVRPSSLASRGGSGVPCRCRDSRRTAR